MCSFRFSCSGTRPAEHLPGLDIELKGDVTLQVADPVVVAFEEVAVLVLVRGQGLERGAGIALFVALEMLGHVVREEGVQQVQLVVIILVKCLAAFRSGSLPKGE